MNASNLSERCDAVSSNLTIVQFYSLTLVSVLYGLAWRDYVLDFICVERISKNKVFRVVGMRL